MSCDNGSDLWEERMRTSLSGTPLLGTLGFVEFAEPIQKMLACPFEFEFVETSCQVGSIAADRFMSRFGKHMFQLGC